nr:right-handed parallel beta-helix repeat-containing protein [Micromonospora tarapacensis]
MSDDVTTSNGGPPPAPPARHLRRLWVTAGVAGLTGVVGLAALGGLAARDKDADGAGRVSDASASMPKQSVSDAGKAEDDARAKGHEDDSGDGEDDWSGGDWGGKGEGRKGEDGHGRAKEVPCKAEALVEAVNKALRTHDDVLKLAPRCEYRLTRESNFNAFPVVDGKITILGNGATLVHEGTRLFRFFEVASRGELTLKDLTLKGGQVSGPPPERGRGGALLVQQGGKALLHKTTLVHNRATGQGNSGNGGAIYNSGHVTLEDSVARDNHARGLGNGGNGGAIYNEGRLDVRDSELAKNTATSNADGVGGSGGAIANFDGGHATVSHSTIKDNAASNDGGGINSEGSSLTVTFTKVEGNTGGDEGGGIYTAGDRTAELRHLLIAGNTASADGGGVWYGSSGGVITDSRFLDNTAGFNGGGLFTGILVDDDATGGVLLNGFGLLISKTEFEDNDARQGGGIYHDAGDLEIRDSKIVKNFAGEAEGAGGIFQNGGEVELDKTAVKANQPTNCAGTVEGCFG